MFDKLPNKKNQIDSLEYEHKSGVKILLKIHTEKRTNVRYSIAKNHIICRLPRGLSSELKNEYLKRFEDWFNGQIKKNPKILNRFRTRQYKDGEKIKVGDYEYTIKFGLSERKTLGVLFLNGTILIKLPNKMSTEEQPLELGAMIAKVISRHQVKRIEERVHALNDEFFQKEIKSIKLKNMKSRWGSCSSRKTINLASRILLVPEDVMDYVIIHELAHLVEMNHSERFWNIVKSIMPNYKKKELWLKQNGDLYTF